MKRLWPLVAVKLSTVQVRLGRDGCALVFKKNYFNIIEHNIVARTTDNDDRHNILSLLPLSKHRVYVCRVTTIDQNDKQNTNIILLIIFPFGVWENLVKKPRENDLNFSHVQCQRPVNVLNVVLRAEVMGIRRHNTCMRPGTELKRKRFSGPVFARTNGTRSGRVLPRRPKPTLTSLSSLDASHFS